QTSGESYLFEFQEQDQIVIIQPSERTSGLRVGLDDNRYKPQSQSSSHEFTNSQTSQQENRGGLSDLIGGILQPRK
ncbi:AIM24 family protein, partial [Bacillus pumilus]|nr:AIM24 family protein [Bacillus pumilus]